MSELTRREALRLMGAGAFGLALPGRRIQEDGRLRFRASSPRQDIGSGITRPGLGGGRDGILYVPTAYRAGTAAPLCLLLHGAGQDAELMIGAMKDVSDAAGVVLLAVDSRGGTWDAIRGGYGPDIRFIDQLLGWASQRVRIDPARLTVAGFSDGASYALSIGLINGDLLHRIAAFSPGFVIPGEPKGRPKIFITHGTEDRILPIDSTSRRIVPALKAEGYSVDYREFAGPHTMSKPLLRVAAEWLAAG